VPFSFATIASRARPVECRTETTCGNQQARSRRPEARRRQIEAFGCERLQTLALIPHRRADRLCGPGDDALFIFL
jgi:hypothetical protein